MDLSIERVNKHLIVMNVLKVIYLFNKKNYVKNLFVDFFKVNMQLL